MNKKLLILIPLAIIIIFGLWWILSGGSKQAPVTNQTPIESPFGSAEGLDGQSVNNNFVGEVAHKGEERGNQSINTKGARLFKLTSAPVAGFTSYSKASTTVVRFVDRGTGHIFDAMIPVGSGNVEVTRLTNNTITPVYEAHFKADASVAVFRTLDEVNEIRNSFITITAPNGTSTGLYTFKSLGWNEQADSLAVGSGNTLYYVDKNSGAINSIGFQGEGRKTLWASQFKSWVIHPVSSGAIIATKASYNIPGFAYKLSSAGALTKILGPLNALTVNSNKSGDRIIYSYSNGGEIKTFAQNLSGKPADEINPGTLAEKCVWSAKLTQVFYCGTPLTGITGAEPDNWYKGVTHFTDYIWRFDTNSKISTLISNPSVEFDTKLDIYKPALSVDENYFIFLNKTDLSLWVLSLR